MKDSSAPTARQDVLIKVHPDGYLEAFGPKSVNVLIRVVPDIPTVDPALVDDFFDDELPKPFQAIHLPVNLLTMGMVERVSIEDLVHQQTQSEIIRAVREITGRDEGKTIWTSTSY